MESNPYSTAHLIVAAIRVHHHQKKSPPSVADIANMLSFSLEQTHLICRELHRLEIIEVVTGAYGTRLFVKNHMAIEDLSRRQQESRLEEALEEFKSSRSGLDKKIAIIKEKQARKKHDLFAEIEKKLKKGSMPQNQD